MKTYIVAKANATSRVFVARTDNKPFGYAERFIVLARTHSYDEAILMRDINNAERA